MSSSWGNSWGSSWGNSWGLFAVSEDPTNYLPKGTFFIPYRVDGITGEKKAFASLAELAALILVNAAAIYIEPRGDWQRMWNGYLLDAPAGVYSIRGPGPVSMRGIGKNRPLNVVLPWSGTLTVLTSGSPRFSVT